MIPDRSALLKAAHAANELQRRLKYDKLRYFTPYEYQKRFYDAGATHDVKFMSSGNRTGKTRCAAYEVAMHATGIYPTWFKGRQFSEAPLIWAIGLTTEQLRDVIQMELFGVKMRVQMDELGSGAIPREKMDIDNIEWDGNNIITCRVKHVSGDYATIVLKSAAQGFSKLQGSAVHYIWMDEEPPQDSNRILRELRMRTATTKGLVSITATPTQGMTELMELVMANPGGHFSVQHVSMYDAPHLDKAWIDQQVSAMNEWEVDARVHGIPSSGGGQVYPIIPQKVKYEGIEIQTYWPKVCGVDFGWSHPAAAVFVARDPDNDIYYVYHAKSASQWPLAGMASHIVERGNPLTIWPHDGGNGTQDSAGETKAGQLKKHGVNTNKERFYNPIGKDGKKNNSVELGLDFIRNLFLTDRIFIHESCQVLLSELMKYRYNNGKPVKMHDDSVDAMRYAIMSLASGLGRPVNKTEDFNLEMWNNTRRSYF